jgi:hypothetical protein
MQLIYLYLIIQSVYRSAPMVFFLFVNILTGNGA